MIFTFNRQQVIDQALSNLTTAGVIRQEEIAGARRGLENLSAETLVRILLVSHNLREQSRNKSIVPIGEICLN